MTNILEGMQYRTITLPFADLTPSKGSDIFDLIAGGGWIDVPEGMVSFPAKTELRYKPEKVFKIHDGATYRSFPNRADLMVVINKKLDNEEAITVSTGERASTKRSDSKLQAFDGNNWVNVVINGHAAHFTYAAKFRIRPDYYHTVTTNDSLITGTVTFHDIEALAKYVDNRIRTNGFNFSVTKVKY